MAEVSRSLNKSEHLVNTDWLERSLDDPDLRVFDCTVNVDWNPDVVLAKKVPLVFESGRSKYDEGHVPGAGFIDLLNDISDRSSAFPLMMPPEQQFADVMSKLGVGDGNRVVLYSTDASMWATRVWWMLRAFGFNNATILDGGWSKWVAEGRPVSSKASTYAANRFTAQLRPGIFVGRDEVMGAIGENSVCMINALAPDVYDGTSEYMYGRKGHIPGSFNVPYFDMNNPDTGTYVPLDRMRQIFEAVHTDDADRIILYCGGGIGSTNLAFSLSLLGYENIAVYDASMFEWGADAGLPMEIG